MRPNDIVVCVDATGPYMEHLEQGKAYTVEFVDGANIRLHGVAYTTKQWRFKLDNGSVHNEPE